MKLKVAVAIILSCVLVGVAAASYVQLTTGISSHSFTLTASGRAYNKRTDRFVTIRLSVTGTADGRLTTVLHMYVAGGTVKVQYHPVFPVSKGYGTLVQKSHYITLAIKMSSGQYGGPTTYWDLRGTTENVIGKTLPVLFYAYRVIIPTSDNNQLYYVSLKGTLTIS